MISSSNIQIQTNGDSPTHGMPPAGSNSDDCQPTVRAANGVLGVAMHSSAATWQSRTTAGLNGATGHTTALWQPSPMMVPPQQLHQFFAVPASTFGSSPFWRAHPVVAMNNNAGTVANRNGCHPFQSQLQMMGILEHNARRVAHNVMASIARDTTAMHHQQGIQMQQQQQQQVDTTPTAAPPVVQDEGMMTQEQQHRVLSNQYVLQQQLAQQHAQALEIQALLSLQFAAPPSQPVATPAPAPCVPPDGDDVTSRRPRKRQRVTTNTWSNTKATTLKPCKGGDECVSTDDEQHGEDGVEDQHLATPSCAVAQCATATACGSPMTASPVVEVEVEVEVEAKGQAAKSNHKVKPVSQRTKTRSRGTKRRRRRKVPQSKDSPRQRRHSKYLRRLQDAFKGDVVAVDTRTVWCTLCEKHLALGDEFGLSNAHIHFQRLHASHKPGRGATKKARRSPPPAPATTKPTTCGRRRKTLEERGKLFVVRLQEEFGDQFQYVNPRAVVCRKCPRRLALSGDFRVSNLYVHNKHKHADVAPVTAPK